MPTHFQQTVDIRNETTHDLGPVTGLSTSDTQRLKSAFPKSPIHKEEITRESVRSTFNALVLNGPADIGPNGEIVCPPGAVVDNADGSGGDPFGQATGGGAGGAGGAGGGGGAGGDGTGGGGGAGGAPNIGGEGGTPKGPNIAAASELFAGASDDGLASPPVPGAAPASLEEKVAQMEHIAANAALGSANAASIKNLSTGGSAAGGGAAGAGAGGGGGAGGAGGGGGADGPNTIYGAGAPGAGGAGGGAGGSDDPAKSTKIIAGQEVGKLYPGTSTPTACKIP